MINFKRSWAVFLRYFYLFTKFDQIADLFYWPMIDIVIWGLTTVWIQKQQTDVPDIALVILTGLIFWQTVLRGNYEIAVNLLQEFWNRNLVNLFSTPLRIIEWIIGVLMLSVCKVCISMVFGVILVYLLYALNVFTMGWAFLPFIALLMMSGWVVGLIAASLVIYWGQRFQMLAWMLAFVFAPFSAVFYPVTALPLWGQKIAWYLPTTYVFEGMRSVLRGGAFPWGDAAISLGLNLFYLFLSICVFYWFFERSRSKGLARFE